VLTTPSPFYKTHQQQSNFCFGRREMSMSKIAWIGLGVMGYPMAGHIRQKSDHDVVVYNRNAQKAEK